RLAATGAVYVAAGTGRGRRPGNVPCVQLRHWHDCSGRRRSGRAGCAVATLRRRNRLPDRLDLQPSRRPSANVDRMSNDKRLVILISGRGSNMKALLEARLPARVSAVISNEPRANGLEVARGFGVTTRVVHHRDFADRGAFDNALM